MYAHTCVDCTWPLKRTFVGMNISLYRHAYIHTNIAILLVSTSVCMNACLYIVCVWSHTGCLHTQTHRHTDTQTHRHTDTQTHRHTDRTHTHTHTHTHTTHAAAKTLSANHPSSQMRNDEGTPFRRELRSKFWGWMALVPRR
jgi:hypothetical protein